MAKTAEQIAAEKNAKPRPDLVPTAGVMGAATAFAVGVWKHGLADNGRGTYRVPKSEQARVSTHMASLGRHYEEAKAGKIWVPDVPEDCPLKMTCYDAMLAQASIVADLIADPPGGYIHQHDLRYYPPEVVDRAVPSEDEDDPWWQVHPSIPCKSQVNIWVRGGTFQAGDVVRLIKGKTSLALRDGQEYTVLEADSGQDAVLLDPNATGSLYWVHQHKLERRA